MAKFRKKPVVIEAYRMPFSDDPSPFEVDRLHEWADKHGLEFTSDDGGIAIETLEGTMLASPGDWIIKGTRGEFYPCKPDVFKDVYEPVE